MKKILNTKKKIIFLSFVSLILILLVSFLTLNKTQKKVQENKNLLPTEIIIPTIDKSVKIELIKTLKNHEVVLKIENAPKETESIEYTLFYNTTEQGIQGVNGILEKNSNQIYERKILLGTCSSGSCVYHEVVDKIKLNLRFVGTYGERLFEKEY